MLPGLWSTGPRALRRALGSAGPRVHTWSVDPLGPGPSCGQFRSRKCPKGPRRAFVGHHFGTKFCTISGSFSCSFGSIWVHGRPWGLPGSAPRALWNTFTFQDPRRSPKQVPRPLRTGLLGAAADALERPVWPWSTPWTALGEPLEPLFGGSACEPRFWTSSIPKKAGLGDAGHG